MSVLPLLGYTGKFFQKGQATFYAEYLSGRKTSSGEKYDPGKMTAAHATLPLQSYVQVKNLRNGKTVVVKINDRMSRKSRFIIDLSKAAASELGIVSAGMAPVHITSTTKPVIKEEFKEDTDTWAEWK